VTDYKDTDQELLIHWGLGIKNSGEWTGADEKFCPPNTAKFFDGKACQTSLLPNSENKELRLATFIFEWIHE
jgi:hypothetical protein